MTKRRVKVDDLPPFDAAPRLDSERAIAAYLTDYWKRMTRRYWPMPWATSLAPRRMT
jgi:hypothetical protein